MKKFVFILAAFAALALSCKEEALPVVKEDSVPQTLFANIEEAATSAGFNYNSGTHTYRHFWESGDEIAFFPKSNSGKRYSCTNPSIGEFSFVSNSNDPSSYSYSYNYALFPLSYSIGFGGQNDDEMVALLEMEFDTGIPVTSAGVLNVEIPKAESFAPDANTLGYGSIMVARSEDDNLSFKNCLGWLKIQLKGMAPVKSIKVQGRNSEVLSGAGTISFDGSGNPVLTMNNSCAAAEAYKIVNINSPYLTLNEVTPTPFYFPLPPITFTKGITVTVTYENGLTESFSTSNSVAIERNTVTPMAVKEAESAAELNAGTLFSVAIKRLAFGDSTPNVNSEDNLIKGIQASYNSATTGVEVQSDLSPYKIYAVFDGVSGIITLHTPAYRIKLNANSEKMFYKMKELESIDFLPEILPSTLTNNLCMFEGCTKLSSVDFSKITFAASLNSLFKDCAALTSLDMNNFHSAAPTSFLSTFSGCTSLSGIDLSGINTSSVETFQLMFEGCTSLNTIDLSSLNTSSAVYFNNMFSGCTSLQTVSFGTSFLKNADTSTMQNMFFNCSSLQAVDITGNVSLTGVNMGYMCYGCTSLESFSFGVNAAATSLDRILINCSNVTSVDLRGVTNNGSCSLAYAFYSCPKVSTLRLDVFEFGVITQAFNGMSSSVANLDLYCKNATEFEKMKDAGANGTYLFKNKTTVHYTEP